MSTAHDSEWKRLGSGELLTEDADVGLGHVLPTVVYFRIFLALLVLTVLTVAAAALPVGEGAHLGIAMLIATIKAALVIFVFMHVNYENKLIRFVALYPVIIFLLMLAGTLGDRVEKKFPTPSNPKAILLQNHGEKLHQSGQH